MKDAMKKFRTELIWNREFHWCHWSDSETMEDAKKSAVSIRDSGDGERVKKVRVIDNKTDKVVWEG